jgi:hypothetical protein
MRILVAALAALAFLVPGAALATTQIPDAIIIDGQKHPLFSLPLEQYYGPGRPRPQFRPPNTATWRGYIATWVIDRECLYLQSIRAWTGQGEVGLSAIFPGQTAPLPATWFTGQLRVPQGKVLRVSVPHPVHEKDLVITVEKGRVARQAIVDNAGRVGPLKR